MGKNKNKRDRNKKYFFMGGGKGTEEKEDKSSKCHKKSIGPKDEKETTSSHSSSHSNFGFGSWKKPDTQPVQNPDNVINTDKGFFEFAHSTAWGTILVPVEDPKASKVTHDEVNGIKLIDNFPKVPAKLWARWISLCFHFCPERPVYSSKPIIHKRWNSQTSKYDHYKYVNSNEVSTTEEEYTASNSSATNYSSGSSSCHSGELEVSMLLCRKIDDLTQWRVLIPKQSVTGASVHADLSETMDIETGERFTAFPPAGWVHAGSSHSHNTMSAFFSGTDDKSELTVPGLHIVVGRIDKKEMLYEHKASIVLRQLRKNVDLFDVVDAQPVEDVNFHADVLEIIKHQKSYSGPSSYPSSNGPPSSPPSSSHSSSPGVSKSDRTGFGCGAGWDVYDDYPGEDTPPTGSVRPTTAKDHTAIPRTLLDLCGADVDDCGDGFSNLYLPVSVQEEMKRDREALKAAQAKHASIDSVGKPSEPKKENPSSKKSLEELEKSLERAIEGNGDLDLNDIMAYYEKVDLPYDPKEWSGGGI